MAQRKKKRRSKTLARARKAKPRKPKTRPKPKAKPRKPKPKPKPRKPAKKRSAAAKKGWEKRRKKERLLQAMVDRRLRPTGGGPGPGWVQLKLPLEQFASDETPEQRAKRLAFLREIKLDFPTRDELYDYLVWAADEFDMDISDLYRMYFGYRGRGDT